MTIELNAFNVIKQPYDYKEVVEVDMIETLVDDSFVSDLCDEPFEKCLTDLVYRLILTVLLKKSILYLIQFLSWIQLRGRQEWSHFPPYEKKNIPPIETTPKIELKELPKKLDMVFWNTTKIRAQSIA